MEYKNHHTDKLRRRLILGGVVAVAGGAYFLHRRRISTVIDVMQDAAHETMWTSFDAGVKYGLELAKQGITDTREAGQYAFDAFDKAT